LERCLIKKFDLKSSLRSNQIIWDGSDENGKEVSSGIYFVTFISENIRQVRKVEFFNK
jgi:hypothetical protein